MKTRTLLSCTLAVAGCGSDNETLDLSDSGDDGGTGGGNDSGTGRDSGTSALYGHGVPCINGRCLSP